MENLEHYKWNAVSNRASGISARYFGDDPVLWVSSPGRWARCIEVRKSSPAYRAWDGLKVRTAICKKHNYIDSSCCDEWHKFQVFADWFYSNKADFTSWEVDKDILVPGNKVYCPEFCGLVPNWLNKFYAFHYITNQSGFPGVSFSKARQKWVVRCQSIALKDQPKPLFINDFEEACGAYCDMKEGMAKSLVSIARNQGVDHKYLSALENFKVKDYLREE